MEWKISQSTVRPAMFDTTSSRFYNYMRRNVEERTIERAPGITVTVYVYEEIKVPKSACGY